MRRQTNLRRIWVLALVVSLVAPPARAYANSGQTDPVSKCNPNPESLVVKTDTISLWCGMVSPRAVKLPAGVDAGSVKLTDDNGRVIPMTGEQARKDAEALLVFPPKLGKGTYSLSYPGGVETIVVGKPQTPTEVNEPKSDPKLNPWLLGLPPLVLAAALYMTKRRRLGALALVVALGVPLVGNLLPEIDLNSATDPCPPAGYYVSEDIYECMTTYMQTLVLQEGVAAAMSRLELLSERDEGDWDLRCHGLSHDIGAYGWKTELDPETLVDSGTLSCNFGYFHGILETMGTYVTDEKFSETALLVCDRLVERFSVSPDGIGARDCAHGVGHAVMWRHNGNLTRAAPVCETLKNLVWVEECRAGAVMSWVFARDAAVDNGRPQDAPEPAVSTTLELCAPPYGAPTKGCVEGALSDARPEEYRKSLEWCGTTPGFVETCYVALGRLLVSWESWDAAHCEAACPDGYTGFADEVGNMCEIVVAGPGNGSIKERNQCMIAASWSYQSLRMDYAESAQMCTKVETYLQNACKAGILQYLRDRQYRGDNVGVNIPKHILEQISTEDVENLLTPTEG